MLCLRVRAPGIGGPIATAVFYFGRGEGAHSVADAAGHKSATYAPARISVVSRLRAALTVEGAHVRTCLTAASAAMCLTAILSGCGSSNQVATAHASPIPSSSVSAAGISSTATGSTTYPSMSALEAALTDKKVPCLSPQVASTAGIKGAIAAALCYGGFRGEMTQPDVRLILFDSHADAKAWQAARAASTWEGYYIIGGNWGIAGPATYGLFVVRELGGDGISPTASPGFSTDAAPP